MARMTGRKIRRKKQAGEKEIERRFLVKYIPEYIQRGIEEGKFLRIDLKQGYVPNKKGERLRSETSKYKISHVSTIKTGEGEVRPEDNRNMRRRIFWNFHWHKVNYWLQKVRYHIPYGKHIIELNFFKTVNGELVHYDQAEIESKSRTGSKKFVPPDWFDREVTNDSKHSSFSIAKNGVPKEGI